MIRHLARLGVLLAIIACDSTKPDNDVQPSVFVLTNATSNAVVMYPRNTDGTLGTGQSFSTQGSGLDASLGSQGALNLSADRRWLIAANAGSDDVTVFRIGRNSLEFVQKIASGGDMPVSIARRSNSVLVLNAGGMGNVTRFTVGADGRLTASGVVRPLSGATAPMPAQVQFSSDGSYVVVTEKATNNILTYPISADASLGQPVTHISSGTTPFGFDFTSSGVLVVSEAFAPAGSPVMDGSAMSSYASVSGNLAAISASVPTTETAACWVVITSDDEFAYTTNTGSNSVTGYSIAATGALTRLDASGVTANSGGSMPVEMALSADSEFLYVLNTGDGSVGIFRVEADGGLTSLGIATGLSANAYGMAAW